MEVPEVHLPLSVEKLLDEICSKHSLPPADAELRRKLASAGEDRALQVLHTIADKPTKVRTLHGFVTYLLRQPQQPPPRNSPPSQASPSPSRSPAPESPRPSDSPARRDGGGASEMEALGELEFRKQFLILNYIGGMELQSVTTAEEVRGFKDLPIAQFEKQVWERFGKRFVDPEDRRICHDWDSGNGNAEIYRCYVSSEGRFRFKGPYMEKRRTHLQKVIGDDNVLMVKFAEDEAEKFYVGSRDHYYAGYSKICREGIWVGLRRYCFFVFKDGGKEKTKDPTSSSVKCFFVRMHSSARIDQNGPYILSNKTISEARNLFMHARTVSTVSNYMIRFSLILSKTWSLDIDLSSVDIDIIEDEYCQDESGNRIYRDGKPLIHTDGTGFISEDLALLCPKNLHKGRCVDDINNEAGDGVAVMEHLGTETLEPPMLMQFRMFNKGRAVKGTFLVNKKLAPKTIKIRHSMVKVEPDPKLVKYQTADSLEIVGTSNPPKTKRTFLSRILIALLSYGGVPDEYFKGLLWNALRESHGAFNSKRTAIRVAINQGGIDDDSTVARMILSGIPLEEPYLQHRLSVLVKEERKSLREGKLYVDDCFYLMGTADPTGKLERDEVCIVLANGQVSGKVLVYHYPGLHFGDIHVLKATYIEELESYVGNAKYAIFFSRKGPRSVADEIAGADFDGDMYWISRNPELLKYFKPSDPWIQKSSTGRVESKRPIDFSDEDLEDELIKLFLKTRFEPCFARSEAADSWLALADRFLTLGNDCIDEKNAVKENLNKLIDIYYDALDAPKSGAKVEVPRELKPKIFPHYMEKQNCFHSKSILGWIYDEVDSYQPEDHSNIDIFKLPHFDDEVPEACLKKWEAHYKRYREEMRDALDKGQLKNEAADEVKRKYKRLLYGAEELEESTKNMEEIYNESLAIYRVSYDYARSQGKVSYCSFAWNIAGSALLKLHASKKKGERAYFYLPSVLKEVL